MKYLPAFAHFRRDVIMAWNHRVSLIRVDLSLLWSRNVCSFATAREKRDIYLLQIIAVASIKQLDDEIETNFKPKLSISLYRE